MSTNGKHQIPDALLKQLVATGCTCVEVGRALGNARRAATKEAKQAAKKPKPVKPEAK